MKQRGAQLEYGSPPWLTQVLLESGQLPRGAHEAIGTYIGLLNRWRKTTNLMSENAFPTVWTRHIADCAQVLALAPKAVRWLDLGSGAGLPGAIIAISLSAKLAAMVHCVESDKRKCAFLRQVARLTGAPLRIHECRIEAIACACPPEVQAITARGLASLPKLVKFSKTLLECGAIAIFPRGKIAADELTALTSDASFTIETFSSSTDALSRVVRIRDFSRVPR